LGTPVDPAAGSEYASELKRFRDALDKTDVPWSELRGILSLTNGERRKKADEICQNKKKKFDDVAKHFQKILELRRPRITDSIRDAPASFRPDSNFPQALERDALQGLLSARLCLLYYNKNFIFYDMVMYPVEYGTGAGETTEVEIFRVSPEDAPLLMDEKPGDIESSKLAGRTLMSFGAFLDEPWRRNDMLWGRLDGAERLICTLLPLPDRIALDPNETPAQKTEREILDNKHQERATLIFEAHRGILIEEIKQNNGDAVCTLLRHAAFHPNKDSHAEKLIQALLDEKDDKDVLSKLTAERRARLGTPQSLNRQLNAQSALGYISRSTNITGNMLAGLAENYRIAPAKRFASWMASLGAGLWNLISVAVPESLGSLFFRHWLRLLYFVAAVLILLGLVSPSIKLTGWEFLLIVIALHSIVAGLRSFMEGKLTTDKLKAALWAAAAWFPLALIMTGIIHLIERQFDISLKTWMELSIAGGIALATSLFIFYLRKTEAPALSPDARKLRAEAQPVANKS